jgi:hypothetical protein
MRTTPRIVIATIGTANQNQSLVNEPENEFEDGPDGCAFAWKNSVMGDAPESLDVREDKPQTDSRVFKKE